MYGEITFPGLGLSFNPNRVAFHIGQKGIYWYGIIIAVGFLLAVLYAVRRSKQFGLTQDDVIDMLLWAVPLAVIGARAYYCIFSWDLYRDDPIRVLYIWEGGLAIYGGIIGAVIGLLISTKWKKISTAAMLDIGGLGLMIGQSIGRWGNFINREAFGEMTDSFLRMGLTDINGNVAYYHPTFLYESLWNALGFLLIHFYSRKRKYDGQVFTMYVGWYGLGRLFIEGLRTDSLYFAGTNLRVSQLVAGICVFCAAVLLFYNKIFKEQDPEELYVHVRAEREAEKAAEAVEVTDEAVETAEAEETKDALEEAENNEEA